MAFLICSNRALSAQVHPKHPLHDTSTSIIMVTRGTYIKQWPMFNVWRVLSGCRLSYTVITIHGFCQRVKPLTWINRQWRYYTRCSIQYLCWTTTLKYYYSHTHTHPSNSVFVILLVGEGLNNNASTSTVRWYWEPLRGQTTVYPEIWRELNLAVNLEVR